MINYIKQINGFWAWRRMNALSHAQVDLYFAVLDCVNRYHWDKYVSIPNATLISMCGSSKSELLRNRKYLQKMNLIRYYPGQAGRAGHYSVVSLEDQGWFRNEPDFSPDFSPGFSTDFSTDCSTDFSPLIKKEKETETEKETEKIYYKPCVSLLQSEYDALCQEYRKERADKMIEVLNWYKESMGKEYRSDYAAIKSWAADRVLADEQKKEQKQNSWQGDYEVFQDHYDHKSLESIAREKLNREDTF